MYLVEPLMDRDGCPYIHINNIYIYNKPGLMTDHQMEETKRY